MITRENLEKEIKRLEDINSANNAQITELRKKMDRADEIIDREDVYAFDGAITALRSKYLRDSGSAMSSFLHIRASGEYKHKGLFLCNKHSRPQWTVRTDREGVLVLLPVE